MHSTRGMGRRPGGGGHSWLPPVHLLSYLHWHQPGHCPSPEAAHGPSTRPPAKLSAAEMGAEQRVGQGNKVGLGFPVLPPPNRLSLSKAFLSMTPVEMKCAWLF